MTEKEIDKYQAPQAFHEHTEEYDSWFEDSLVYEIEVTALISLHVEMDDPKMEIGVGPGRLPRPWGFPLVSTRPGHVEQNEAPKDILDEHAGFAVIVVRKNHA
jgi:hypothetical protein